MTLEAQKLLLSGRISVLKGRSKDNHGVVRKLERQLRNIEKELEK
ncbi:hypothetical protein [Alkaliphilus sp. B6464]|nr:hypothetical protein [Alkaliphilus sp. B6464]